MTRCKWSKKRNIGFTINYTSNNCISKLRITNCDIFISRIKRIFNKKDNYILVTENYELPNKDKLDIKYQLFSNTNNLNISIEIDKIPDAKQHALYFLLNKIPA